MHTRFAGFINVPGLMAVFGKVADIRTAEMPKLPVLRLRGGKPRVVACPASNALKVFVQTLVQRAEAIRSGHVKPQDDTMLAITIDGRKAALDFRVAAQQARFDENVRWTPSGATAGQPDERIAKASREPRNNQMTDPRNIAHDKKVQQEKKHKGEDIAIGTTATSQPGKKPHKEKHTSDKPDEAAVTDDTESGQGN